MIKIDIKTKDISKTFDFLNKKIYSGALAGLEKAMKYAEGETKASFGTPGKPGVRTGHLRRSIQSGVIDKIGSKIEGAIWSNLIYARIQELGGVVLPKKKPYMRFQIDGRWITSYGYRVPARPYLKPAVDNNIDKIKDIIIDSVINNISRGQ